MPTVSTYVGGSGDWIVELDDIDDWVHLPPPLPGIDLFLYPDNNASRVFSVITGTGSGSYLRLRNELLLPITVNDLHVQQNDTFEVDNSTLQIAFPGFVENDGTILLDNGQITTAILLPGLLTVYGGGAIQMSGDNATIGSLLGAVTIEDQTISGEGTITGTILTLDSTLDANVLGETLNLTFSISGESDGDLFASDGGKLEIKSAVGDAADFVNDGLIQARRGGVVELRDMDMDNDGTVQAVQDGIVQLKNIEVDNGGHLFDIADGQMNLRGDVTIKNGVIQTGAAGWVVSAEGTNNFSGTMTLTGNFRVDPGSTLDFEPGSYLADGATFDAQSLLNLHNAAVTGGTFTGSGQVYVRESSTLIGSTIDGGQVYLPGSPGGFTPRVLTLIDHLSMHSGGTLTIDDQTIGFGTGDAELRIDGSVTIDGDGGVIRFGQRSYELHVNAIRAVNNGHLTLGQHVRIEAPGPAGFGLIETPITNHGTIDANGGEIHLQSSSITNTGSIGASDGGTLRLRNGVPIYNAGGRVHAGEGSQILYDNTVIHGGALDGTGTHRISGFSALDGTSGPVVIDDALVYIPGNTRLTLRGQILNNGNIFMFDDVLGFGTINAELVAEGNVFLGGTGRITLDQVNHSNNNHEFRAADASSSFTFGPDLTITTETGEHGVGAFYSTIHNQGTIQTHGGTLSFLNASMTNTGQIRALDGGKIQFGLNASPQIVDNTDGVLFVDETSQITLSGTHVGATIRGGVIAGGGEVILSPHATLDGTGQRVTVRDATVRLTGGGALGNFGYIYGEVHLDNGSITLQTPGGFGHHNRLYLQGSNPRITGTGSIAFLPAFGTDNRIEAAAPFTVDSGITIGSVGGVGALDINTLTNHGTIDANGGQTYLETDTLANSGVLQASDNGTLYVGKRGAAWLTLDNAGGGRLIATPGATILLGSLVNVFGDGTGVTMHGGTFSGGGTFQIASAGYLYSTPDNPVTFGPGALTVRAGGRAWFTGTFHMDGGTLKLDDSHPTMPDAVFHASGATILTGNGTVTFGPAGFNLANYLRADAGNSWNLGHGVTITAPTGAFGILYGTINTHGVIHSDGNLRIEQGVTTVFDDGKVAGAGSITVQNGATFINHGTTSPGNSPGQLTINGHYAHTGTSRLLIEIGGTEPGQFDRLQVNGRFTADGVLEVVLIDGFIPDADDVFQILTATQGIIGGFDNILIDEALLRTLDGYFNVTMTSTGLSLTGFVYDPLPEPTSFALIMIGVLSMMGRVRRAA